MGSLTNPNYMIAPYVTHEFNLLNDLLQTGLLDESNLTADESRQLTALGQLGQIDMLSGFGGNGSLSAGSSMVPSNRSGDLMPPPPKDGNGSKKMPYSASDKTREYYLQAADPSGNDNPEERMARVLHAKYEAGLLKPFNYINGYARLGSYLDGHIAASSKQKILRTINQFRPKFREKAQGLTDWQLIVVEMWFEKQLMDYDRVFASMAVPACCWRRTGEIFRGNKEMAELISVPVDKLRDVSSAICSWLDLLSFGAEVSPTRRALISTAGQDLPARNPDGRVDGQILGRIRHDCLRPGARHLVDGLLLEESERHIRPPGGEMLLLLHHPARRPQIVSINALTVPIRTRLTAMTDQP